MSTSFQQPPAPQPERPGPSPAYVLLVATLAVVVGGWFFWPRPVALYFAEAELELPAEEARRWCALFETGRLESPAIPPGAIHWRARMEATDSGHPRLLLSAAHANRQGALEAVRAAASRCCETPHHDAPLEALLSARVAVGRTWRQLASIEGEIEEFTPEAVAEFLSAESRVPPPVGDSPEFEVSLRTEENPRWTEVHQELISLRLRMERLLTVHTEQHPLVMAGREQIANLESQLARLPRYHTEPNPKPATTPAPSPAATAARIANEEQVKRAWESRLARLREARAAHEQAVAAEAEAWQAWHARQASEPVRRVLEPAQITGTETNPSIGRLFLLLFSGLMFGGVLALLASLPEPLPVFRSPAEVEQTLQVPLLGAAPGGESAVAPHGGRGWNAARLGFVRLAARGCEMVLLATALFLLLQAAAALLGVETALFGNALGE